MDASSGRILAAVNPHARLPIASTTKMMTALVALQHGRLDDRIPVPASAFNFESDATVMGLRPGETVTLRDLLYGLLLPSGADAANTIAIHYGGSEAGFVAMMNREAAALGMRDTHYVNAHGLPASGHVSSAFDLALLAQTFSYIPQLMAIVAARSYRWNGHILVNVNHVLFWYPGVDGIKPGYTYEAGICQVLDARRGSRHIIVVLLNTPDLVTDARNLLNDGLQDYTWHAGDLPGDGPLRAEIGRDRQGAYSFYPASGHYVRAPFLTALASLGGVVAFGLPRTEALWSGKRAVQYFQNGALQLDATTGRVTRLPLGQLEAAARGSVATPTPTLTARPTPSVTPLPLATPRAGGAGTRAGGGSALKATPTPAPRPAPGPSPSPSVAAAFASFLHAHAALLGAPASSTFWSHGVMLQLFAYGALAQDPRTRHVVLLPIGDRVLFEAGGLPPHAGNVYGPQFAPSTLLASIGWLSHR